MYDPYQDSRYRTREMFRAIQAGRPPPRRPKSVERVTRDEIPNLSIKPAKRAPRSSPELEKWLLEAADSPTSPLTHEDFNSIRERVRNRTGLTIPKGLRQSA